MTRGSAKSTVYSYAGTITIILTRKDTTQKMKFSIKDFFSKYDQIRSFPPDLVTFTEEIFYGKLHFLCSDRISYGYQDYQINRKNLFIYSIMTIAYTITAVLQNFITVIFIDTDVISHGDSTLEASNISDIKF